MDNGVSGGKRRSLKLLAGAVLVLLLVGCGGLGLLPREGKASTETFKTYEQVHSAYTAVTPGVTRLADLRKIGFDAGAYEDAEILSYLGVVEHFVPLDTEAYDRLAPQVRACIETQERCTAYVFHPTHIETRRAGNAVLDFLGFEHRTVRTGWSADVVLLMQDGRVAYKVMNGRPHIDEVHEQISPLGPLQGIGNSLTRTAARIL
jgi:hypothetical protein